MGWFGNKEQDAKDEQEKHKQMLDIIGKKKSDTQNWEYLNAVLTHMGNNNDWYVSSINNEETKYGSWKISSTPDFLNQMGEQGWELVLHESWEINTGGSNSKYLFKRPC